MDTTDTIALIVLGCIAVFGGFYTARSSAQRETIHSGGISSILNYLASALLIALAPSVLCTLFVLHPTFLGEEILLPGLGWDVTEFAHAIAVALAILSTALLLLLPYAILEKPFLEQIMQKEDRGWTREDAETSGL